MPLSSYSSFTICKGALLACIIFLAECDYKIGAFNIQTFGKAKYSKEEIKNYLVNIVVDYDLILIQEIKDSSETTIFNFLSDCQVSKPTFDMVVSPRLGRTSYKEQYAIIFDSAKLALQKDTVYENSNDLFARPPITVHFSTVKSSGDIPDFTVFGVHIDPDDVVQELDEFPAAYEYAIAEGYPAKGILMGDMNADCSYLSKKKYDSLKMVSDSRFLWLNQNELDTTVSLNTDCFYDRIVLCGELDPADFAGPTIDYFDQVFAITNDIAKQVSDHYPVYVLWKTDDFGKNGSVSVFCNLFSNLIFGCFPVLHKHRNKDWFELSLFFITITAIFLIRRVFNYVLR